MLSAEFEAGTLSGEEVGEMGEVTQKARDKVCPGCGGRGAGVHRNPACEYLREQLARADVKAEPRMARRKEGS